ncbi:kinase domain protein (macronuclear) [Tetrahymena thermophila SB210]|uniref:Kinase domain protein n=1 Tax=Tetrahymena thermophila (strain SB210) TaxID=312017 RepID=I7MGA1_TETTS|nr:kinase domain protein [Tetrahymena thermophila SB210]EAS01274.2 kinase domain protein [Tetrahymena thermophila SB210]|eukprot:XP_001021519.2 kinase domain protein [Tetrahymena thermophila SB210]
MFSRQKSGDNFILNKYNNTHEQSSALYTFHKPYQSQVTSDSMLGSSNMQQINKQQPQLNQQMQQNNRKSYNAISAQSADYASQQSLGSKQVIQKSQNELLEQDVNISDIPSQGAPSLIDFNILQRNGGEDHKTKSINILTVGSELSQNQIGNQNVMNSSNSITNQSTSQSKQIQQQNQAQKKVKSNIFAKQFEQQHLQYQQQQQLASQYNSQSSSSNIQNKQQIQQNQQSNQSIVPPNINLNAKVNKNSLNNVIGLGQKTSTTSTPQNISSGLAKSDKSLNQPLQNSTFKSMKRDVSPIKNAPYQLNNNIEDNQKIAYISSSIANPSLLVQSGQSTSSNQKAQIQKQNSFSEQFNKQPSNLINQILPAGQTQSFIINGQYTNAPVLSNSTYNGVQLQYAPSISTSCSNLSKSQKTQSTYDQYLVKHNDSKPQSKNSIENIGGLNNNSNQQNKPNKYGIQQGKKSSYTSFSINGGNTNSQDFNNAQQLYFQEKSPSQTANNNGNTQIKANGHRRQNSYSHKSSNVATENDEQIEDYNVQSHQNLNLSVGVKNEQQRSIVNFQEEIQNQFGNLNNNISSSSQNADSIAQRMSSSSQSTVQKQFSNSREQQSKKEHFGFNNKISFYNNNSSNLQKQKGQNSSYGIKESIDIYKQNANNATQVKSKNTQSTIQSNHSMSKSLYDKNQFSNGKFEWRHKTEQNDEDNDQLAAQTYAIISGQSSTNKIVDEISKDQQNNMEQQQIQHHHQQQQQQQQQQYQQNSHQNLQINQNSLNTSKNQQQQNKLNGFQSQHQQSFDKQFLKKNFTNYVLNQNLSNNQKQQFNQQCPEQLVNLNSNQFSSKSAMPSPGSNNIVQRMQKNIFFTKQNSINDESINTSENQMKNSLDSITIQQGKTLEKPSLFKENFQNNFQNKTKTEESNSKVESQLSQKNSSFNSKKPLSFVLSYDSQLISNNYYYNQASPANNTQIQMGFEQKLEMSNPVNKNISNYLTSTEEKQESKPINNQQQQQLSQINQQSKEKYSQQSPQQLSGAQDQEQIKSLYYNLQNQNNQFILNQQIDQGKQQQGLSSLNDLQINKSIKLNDQQQLTQSLNINTEYTQIQNQIEHTSIKEAKQQNFEEQNRISQSQQKNQMNKLNNSSKIQNKVQSVSEDSQEQNSFQQRKKSQSNLLNIPLSSLDQQDNKEEDTNNGLYSSAEQFKMRNKIHEKAINRVNITLKQSKKRNKSNNSKNLEDSQDDSGSDGSMSELNTSKSRAPIGTLTQSNPITPSNYNKQNRHGSMDNLDSYSNSVQNNSNQYNAYVQSDLQKGQRSEDLKQEQLADNSQRNFHYKTPSDTSTFIKQLYQDEAYRKKSPSKTSAQYCKNITKNQYHLNQNNQSLSKKQDKSQSSFNGSKTSIQGSIQCSANEDTKIINGSASLNNQDQNKQANKNFIQVTQDKQIDIEDPMVQKEFSQIVRNLLRLKNDTTKLHSLLNKNEVKSMNSSLNANLTQKTYNKPGNITTSNSQQQHQQQNKHDQLFEKLYQEIVNKFDLKEASNNLNNSHNNLNGNASNSTSQYSSSMLNSHHQSTSSQTYQSKQF